MTTWAERAERREEFEREIREQAEGAGRMSAIDKSLSFYYDCGEYWSAQDGRAELAALRSQAARVDALEQELETIRAEALARFSAVDKDHTMENDTEAWLLEVAQRIESGQMDRGTGAYRMQPVAKDVKK